MLTLRVIVVDVVAVGDRLDIHSALLLVDAFVCSVNVQKNRLKNKILMANEFQFEKEK